MSDLDLIARSADELVKKVDAQGGRFLVVLPRVGTGLGGLGWKVVKPILEERLKDDRYIVVNV